MKTRIFIGLLTTFFLFAGIITSLSQTAEQQYQKGLMQEEGEGNLPGAIDIYNSIVENQNAEQAIQAKALLHVGLCYEKMGKDEATKAYQKLVNNFPSQKNEVAIAKERLSKLILAVEEIESTPPVMINKKIWEDPDIDDTGEISPDGKYLSYTNWNTGDLAVFETASGKKRNLTNIGQGTNYDQFVYTSKWSPDGETLYYSYFILPALFEIRSIGLTDTEPKTICKFEGENSWLNIRDVSNDGKSILATLDINNETSQFIIISASSGNKKIVKEFPSAETDHLRFNDDASGIVYDYPQDDDSGNHDIYYLSINNGKITPLISHQANDFVLGLTSNNNRLVFGSSRSGKPSIWSVEYNNGKTIGNPQFIKTSDYRYLQGLGLSENGALVYCHFPSQTDIYETEINAESGKVITPPYEFTGNFVGANSTPDYSSNGKFMVYVSRRFPYDAKESFRPIGNVLCVQSLEDKSIRVIKPELSNFGFPKCSPDNRSVLVVGWDDYNSIGLYKIDIESGKSNPINLGQNRQFNHHEWSLDGKSVYLMCEGDSGKMEIVNHNLETGEEKILTTGSWEELYTISRSPDGKWIAFLGLDKNRTLNIIPANGGEIRKIHSWEHGDNRSIRHCWSADGKYIYLTKYKNPGQNLLWSLWQIPVDGSEPVNLGLDLTEIWQISAHPDAKHLAYSNEGEKHKSPEVWMLENFLLLENEETTAKEPEGIKIRQIWQAPYLDDLGTVSLDGKYRSYVDWGLGNVGIHNLLADEKKVLTDEAILGELYQFAQSTVISRDGKKIVYSWAKPYNTNELRLINVNNPETELLYKKTGEELYPTAWLSDNDFVASRSIPEDRTIELVTFNVSEKKIKVKKTFLPGQFYEGLACSPDGKYIAYTYLNKAENGNLDINLLSAEGDMDIPLVTHPSNDKVLGWVPGGKEFLFISDRSGSWDLWAIKLDGIKPFGSAKRIYTDIGDVSPMGFTRDGECYFGFSRRNFYSGLAPFSKKTGEVDLESAQSMESGKFGITWSPDGQLLAYINIEDKSKDNPLKLYVKDVKKGEVYQPDNNKLRVASYCWSPDGNSILILGLEIDKLQEKGYKGGIFIVDLKTGQTDPVLFLSEYEFNRPEDDSLPLSRVKWSPDKKSFYFLFQKDRLVNHNFETGEDKNIYIFPDFSPYILETSPDGRNLLFGLEYPDDEKSGLFIIPAAGGKEKLVCTAQEAKSIGWANYSPDGEYIYFVEIPEYNSVLWRVPAEGGKPEKIWSPGKRVEIYDVHPDGNQISFSVRERTTEVRVIENLRKEVEKIYSQNE